MVTREWVAIHRKHHACVETEDDPHSPRILGLNKVLWWGGGTVSHPLNEKSALLGVDWNEV